MLLLVQHRSVWMSSLAALLTAMLLVSGKTNKSRLIASIIVVLITVMAFYMIDQIALNGEFFATVVSKKLAFFNNYQDDPNGYWRVRGWQYVIDRTLERNPLFGLGFSEAGWYDSNNAAGVDVWEHNQYVHVFRATGIVGLFIYVAFLLTTLVVWLKSLRNMQQPYHYLVAVGAGSGIIMNIVYMFFYNQIAFLWVDVGILLIILRLSSQQTVALPQAQQIFVERLVTRPINRFTTSGYVRKNPQHHQLH